MPRHLLSSVRRSSTARKAKPNRRSGASPRRLRYESLDDRRLLSGLGATFSDNFEDGQIDSALWVTGGRRVSWTPADEGSWTWSQDAGIKDGGDPDGYLRLAVQGPYTGNSYGAVSWVRTVYDFNDGKNHLANFAWKEQPSEPHENYGLIQITDGYVPTFAEKNWTIGWIHPPIPEGTNNLLWDTQNNRPVVFENATAKQTWSILILPTGVAQLYDGPDGTGSLKGEATLDPAKPWFVRFMVEDATSAGFGAGADQRNLYSFSTDYYQAIGGVKFNDLDGDGTRDAGEPGLADWKIFLDCNQNGQWDNSEPSQMTDADGKYAFTGLAAGTYTVAEEYRAGWTRTSPATGSQTVVLQPGQVVGDLDFGNWQPAEIRGSKWNDLDGDGVRDNNEPGIAGWQVFLDANTNGRWDSDERSQLTDAQGNYVFTNLPAGQYVLAEVQQAGWRQTSPASTDDPILTIPSPSGWRVDALGDDLVSGNHSRNAVYKFDGDTGSELLRFSTPSGSVRFGIDVMAVGDNVFIGDYQYRDTYLHDQFPEQYPNTTPAIGIAYLYDGSTGENRVVFHNPNPTGIDVTFGYAGNSAVVGSKIAIGAPRDNRVYMYDGSMPSGSTLVDRLPIRDEEFIDPTPASANYFGSSVAALGSKVLIGDYADDTDAPDAGIVYLFDPASPGSPVVRFRNPRGAAGANDCFGKSVAAVGNKVLVGAPGQNEGSANPGVAYLFDADGNLLLTFQNPDPDANDLFGYWVKAAGENVLISAIYDDRSAPRSGAVYLFDGTTGRLLQTYLNPQGTAGATQQFGDGVTLLGNKIVITSGWAEKVYFFWGPSGTSAPGAYTLTLSSGQLATGIDFGNQMLPGEIRGVKFNDLDGDGSRDAGEPGLADWKIFLDCNQNGEWENGEAFEMTDADGNYAFTGLAAGTYTVAEEDRAGWTRTSSATGSQTAVLQPGQTLDGIDFGNWQPTEIRGTKWNDLDGDGVRDEGEPGLAGWTIQLYRLTEREDQVNDPETGNSHGAGTEDGSLFQSFSPTVSTLTGVDLRLRAGGSFPDEGRQTQINLRSESPAGAVLGSSVAYVSGPQATGTQLLVHFDFAIPVELTPGQTYVIEWLSPALPGLPPGAILTWMGRPDNPYPGGNAFGPTGIPDPDQDLNFVTYGPGEEPILVGTCVTASDDPATPGLDEEGMYAFTGLTSGIYSVTEELQPGWVQTFPTDGQSHQVAVAQGDVVNDIDFGNQGIHREVRLPDSHGSNYAVVSRQGDNLRITNNGRVIFEEPLASFRRLTIQGVADKSDKVTVDLAAGGFDVPDGIVFVGASGKQADTLVLRGTAGDDVFWVGAGSAQLADLGIEYSGVEHLTLDGGSGGNEIYQVSHLSAKTAIVDRKGIDALDFSRAAVGVTVDLARDAGQAQKVIVASNNTLALKGTVENVTGSPFADKIKGNSAANTILGGEGDDTLYGGGDNDVLYGGPGDDWLYGDAGDDTIYGESGNNVLVGGAGNDTLDVLIGADDAARNLLIGGLGADILKGGPGEDILIGGTTAYDGNAKKLAAVAEVWKSQELSFDARCQKLDTGFQDPLAGWVQLKRKDETNPNGTVFDDRVRDALFGSPSSDWLFDFATDEVGDGVVEYD